MSTATATGLCRIVLVTPHRTLEIALPEQVPLCELLPVLVLRATTAGLPDGPGRGTGRSLTGEGDWVLQRLGSAPLDEESTPAALQIRDGETLYLRPRDRQLPPAHFDDLIDGIATGVAARPDRWRGPFTRVLFLAICGLALATGLAMLLNPAFPGRMLVAGVVALTLVAGATLCSRALGDGPAALVLGGAAVLYAALGGSLVPVGATTVGPALLCASVSALLAAMTVTFTVGKQQPMLLALWLVTAVGALAGLMTVMGFTAAQSAGTVVVLALVASTFAPSLAFRLARMRLPQLPTNAAELSDDIEPYPAQRVLSGAVVADRYLTSLFLAIGTVVAVGLVVLLTVGGTAPAGLAASVVGVLLIRSRALTGGWQRASVLFPALLGAGWLTLAGAAATSPGTRLFVLVAVVALAGAMLGLSRALPDRRLLPHWGRIADIAEYVVAIAMVLFLLGVYDAYHWARAISG